MERKPWTEQEDCALKNLVEQIGFTNWTLVAARLSKICNGSDRAGKQCRERWINHLDMSISKKPWSKNEEKTIFQMHNLFGNKWKEIAKHLKSRTENDIKNHFYATMRKGIRRLNKLLGFKQNPSDIKRIKPVVLSKLCEEQQQLEVPPIDKFQLNGVFELILKLSRCEPQLEQCEEFLENESLLNSSSAFLEKMINENRVYQHGKLKKKRQCPSKQEPQKENKSEQINIEFDISQYLSLGEQIEQIQQKRPKSQGASIKMNNSSNEDQSSPVNSSAKEKQVFLDLNDI